MKQLHPFLLLVLIGTNVLAQPQRIEDSPSSLLSIAHLTFDAEHKAVLASTKAAETECLVDSMLEYFDGVLHHRFYYQYDANGRLLDFITQSRDFQGFRNGYRYSHTYNVEGLETQELRLIWNTASASWNNDLRYSSVYNPQGNRIEYKMEVWNGTEYLNSDLEIHNYNQSGQLLESVLMSWADNSWEGHARYLYEYDQNDNLITETLLDWDGTGFVYYQKTMNEYNASNNLESTLEQYWLGQEWVNHKLQTLQYDGELLEELLIEDYNGSNWEPDYRIIYTRDQNGLLLEELHQIVDGLTFIGRYKHTHTYNPEGLMVSFLREQNIIGVTNGWESIDMHIYEYDQLGNRTKDSYREWYGDTWSPWYEYEYYFGCNATAIKEHQVEESIAIYPNPTTGQIFIQLEENSDIRSVNLIDISGKVLKTTPVNGSLLQMNLSASPGIYLVELQNPSGNQYQKLLLE